LALHVQPVVARRVVLKHLFDRRCFGLRAPVVELPVMQLEVEAGRQGAQQRAELVHARRILQHLLLQVLPVPPRLRMDPQRGLDDLVVETCFEHRLDVVRLGVLAECLAEERGELLAFLGTAAEVGALLAHAVAVHRVRVVQSRLRAQLDTERFGLHDDAVDHRLQLATHAEPQRVVFGIVLAMALVGLEVALEKSFGHRVKGT
jgi:hypothetical protein